MLPTSYFTPPLPESVDSSDEPEPGEVVALVLDDAPAEVPATLVEPAVALEIDTPVEAAVSESPAAESPHASERAQRTAPQAINERQAM